MIFCFLSENFKFEVRAGRSLPLSIIVKMSCKSLISTRYRSIHLQCAILITGKIPVQNAGILLEKFNVGRLTAQIFHFNQTLLDIYTMHKVLYYKCHLEKLNCTCT